MGKSTFHDKKKKTMIKYFLENFYFFYRLVCQSFLLSLIIKWIFSQSEIYTIEWISVKYKKKKYTVACIILNYYAGIACCRYHNHTTEISTTTSSIKRIKSTSCVRHIHVLHRIKLNSFYDKKYCMDVESENVATHLSSNYKTMAVSLITRRKKVPVKGRSTRVRLRNAIWKTPCWERITQER